MCMCAGVSVKHYSVAVVILAKHRTKVEHARLLEHTTSRKSAESKSERLLWKIEHKANSAKLSNAKAKNLWKIDFDTKRGAERMKQSEKDEGKKVSEDYLY